MQEKKVNGGLKRGLEPSGKEKPEKHEKPKKKLKSQEDNAKTDSINGGSKSTITILDKSIFQLFTDLTQEHENGRVQAAMKLIQTLQGTKEPEKRQKELTYALKRLIRGCGAATNISRSGFFTGLVAFLKTFDNEVEIGSIFDTMQKELKVGATLANKEDADAVVGKILVCGAILRSGKISHFNSEQLERIANILLHAARYKSYHTSISYAFLIEMFENALTEKQFEQSVWPSLHKEITKSWPKQSLHTVHCLIVAHKMYPNILNSKYFKTHFGGRELLNNESFEHLKRIFWSHSDLQIITHPAFEVFGAYLANCQNLVEFWTETINTSIETPTKLTEYLTLKIATDILRNLTAESAERVIVKLFSPNFMKMILNGLRHIKAKKDETLKAFYDEFMEALVSCCAKLPESCDVQKVALIRRLILYPGTFGIEKLTSTRVIHQLINLLGLDGVQDIYLTYKQIFCGILQKQTDEDKTEEWQQYERANSGYMLQNLLSHKAVQHSKNAYEWRTEELSFLLLCGIFHVQQTNSAKNPKRADLWFEPCKKDLSCSFSKDFGEQCKNMFYSSLQSKFNNLQQECEANSVLVKACDKYMQKGNLKKNMRIKIDEKNVNLMENAWEKVKKMVKSTSSGDMIKKSKKDKLSSKSENDKLHLVFHIMLYNMGLQLFREPDMAASAIEDLVKCMQRITKQQKGNIKSDLVGKDSSEDPDWIEVVIDLFLHLLSQNAVALRNSVNSLFPHLCRNLSVSAIHQILAMLDMKDGQNPLSRNNEDSDDESDEEDEQSEDDVSENGNEEESDDGEESDDDKEDDDDDDDEDVTATDKLRNAISQALIESGGATNGADGNNDDDMASVDLNDMTEEEGLRLDAALAAAFKTMKKSNPHGNDRKKTKSERVETTTLMHFRIRVLDLIEIYVQQPDINLLNHIEIMLALYNMLEFCWSEELKPLQMKVEKVLHKLTDSKQTVKQSPVQAVIVEDLKAEDLIHYIRQLAEKKAPSINFDIANKIRNRCIVFLVNNANRLENGDEQVLKLCIEFQTEFLSSRNPTANITLLSEIYKMRKSCVWKLGVDLAEKGLRMETRVFRRIQACEILMVLYKNNELQKLDEKSAQKSFNQIEKILLDYIDNLTASWIKPNARQSHKEFQTLLEVLLQATRRHNRLKTQTPIICSTETCEKVQNLRRYIRLESSQIYQRYCGMFQLSILRNSDVVSVPSDLNGNDVDNDCETEENKPLLSKKKDQRNKQEIIDKRQQKKQKKMERMLAASKGINIKAGFSVKRKSDEDSSDDENK